MIGINEITRISNSSINHLLDVYGRTLGFFAQIFQTGNIQRYIAVFAVGTAILLYGWLTPFDAFKGEPASAQVEAPLAAPGGGR